MPIVTINNKLFEENTDISIPDVWNLTDGSSNPFNAHEELSLPDPENPSERLNCKFLFWNIRGIIYTSLNVTIPNVYNSDFNATAWYKISGRGGPGVRTSTFSIGTNQFLSDTPIATVVPEEAWTSPSKTVDNVNSEVEIKSVDSFGDEDFQKWLVFGGASAVSGNKLTVSQNQSRLAIAMYEDKGTIVENLIEDLYWEIHADFLQVREQPASWRIESVHLDFTRLESSIMSKVRKAIKKIRIFYKKKK